MRRMITTLALAATMVLATASVALANGPNCADFGNHGQHVTGAYATPGVPGGARGGPAHFGFDADVGPGASFCQTHGSNNAKALPERPERP